MTAHPFLSDSWIEEARGLRARYSDQVPPPPVPVRLNVVVTEIPHRDGDLQGHIDASTTGQIIIEQGHMDNADLTITIDYETAKAMFITRDPQAIMIAFLSGKIFVDGDASQLLALAGAQPDSDSAAVEIYQELRSITADDS